MTTLYNKTALKKIKKNDLITMFLDLQASDYNARMDDRKLTNITPFLEEENKGLREELRGAEIAIDIIKQENECNKKNMRKFMRERKELKEENEELHKSAIAESFAIEEQTSIIEKLDDRLVNLRAMEKDITLHPDYQILVELN